MTHFAGQPGLPAQDATVDEDRRGNARAHAEVAQVRFRGTRLALAFEDPRPRCTRIVLHETRQACFRFDHWAELDVGRTQVDRELGGAATGLDLAGHRYADGRNGVTCGARDRRAGQLDDLRS